jgi:hypothetical protein
MGDELSRADMVRPPETKATVCSTSPLLLAPPLTLFISIDLDLKFPFRPYTKISNPETEMEERGRGVW